MFVSADEASVCSISVTIRKSPHDDPSDFWEKEPKNGCIQNIIMALCVRADDHTFVLAVCGIHYTRKPHSPPCSDNLAIISLTKCEQQARIVVTKMAQVPLYIEL